MYNEQINIKNIPESLLSLITKKNFIKEVDIKLNVIF